MTLFVFILFNKFTYVFNNFTYVFDNLINNINKIQYIQIFYNTTETVWNSNVNSKYCNVLLAIF